MQIEERKATAALENVKAAAVEREWGKRYAGRRSFTVRM